MFLAIVLATAICRIDPMPVADEAAPYVKQKTAQPLPEIAEKGRIINAPARTSLHKQRDFFFTGDFIYWQAKEENLIYGITNESKLFLTSFINAKVLNPHFGWHPGFKMGLGGNPDWDHWDLFTEWTHYVSHNNAKTTEPAGGRIYPSLILPIFEPDHTLITSTTASMSWRLIYNTVTFECGRSSVVGRFLNIRPHFGVKAAKFNQSYSSRYSGITEAGPFGTTTVSAKYNSWSLGPRFGLDSKWILGAGFSLLGKLALSMQYMSINLRKNEVNPFFNPNGKFMTFSDSRGHDQVIPNVEGVFGVNWGRHYAGEKYRIDLSLSYEVQYWRNGNGDIHFNEVVLLANYDTGGDLTLQGATFRARFDF